MPFSEQQLVDCDTVTSKGCSGGTYLNGWKYVIKAGGQDTEASYPYIVDPNTFGRCYEMCGKVGAKISEEIIQLEPGDVTTMSLVLENNQLLATAMRVLPSFTHYT